MEAWGIISKIDSNKMQWKNHPKEGNTKRKTENKKNTN